MQLAIGEALFGLIDQAKARVDKAEEDGILAENTVDDRMVVAAITKDGAMARQLLPAALEQQGKSAGDQPAGAERERLLWALAGAGGRQAGRGGSVDRAGVLRRVTHRRRHSLDDRQLPGRRLSGRREGADVPELTEARSGLSPTPAFVYATLARVQMKMGQTDEARKNYQKFLELFKDADPDLPLLVEVKAEIDKLGS